MKLLLDEVSDHSQLRKLHLLIVPFLFLDPQLHELGGSAEAPVEVESQRPSAHLVVALALEAHLLWVLRQLVLHYLTNRGILYLCLVIKAEDCILIDVINAEISAKEGSECLIHLLERSVKAEDEQRC